MMSQFRATAAAATVVLLGGHIGCEAFEPSDIPPLQVLLLPPAAAVEDRGSESFHNEGFFVRHPWPVRDRVAELALEQTGDAPPPTRNVITRDGVEAAIIASPEAVPTGVERGLFVGLFSFSLTVPEASVEQWLSDGNVPPPHNPLRFWTFFSAQYPDGLVRPDELGDACLGEAFRAEFCARATVCFRVTGDPSRGGGGRWHVAAPAKFATNYRIEAYVGDVLPECVEYQPQDYIERKQRTSQWTEALDEFAWWAPLVAEHAVPSRSSVARYAAFTRFRMLHVTKTNYWWSVHARVEPANCWIEMFSAAIDAAANSPAANPGQYGLPTYPNSPRGLWLEFGVGSGKTTATIATRLKMLLGSEIILHGFDSFQGLPISWDHTNLGVGTFSMGGKIPEHLTEMANINIHVGLFGETLGDLDKFGLAPVAFAHIDVDLYASAVEVLSKIACQLHSGSVLVFDELVNYVGFELSGEYRAWEYIAALYQIDWDYAGVFWQQSVPIMITGPGRAC